MQNSGCFPPGNNKAKGANIMFNIIQTFKQLHWSSTETTDVKVLNVPRNAHMRSVKKQKSNALHRQQQNLTNLTFNRTPEIKRRLEEKNTQHLNTMSVQILIIFFLLLKIGGKVLPKYLSDNGNFWSSHTELFSPPQFFEVYQQWSFNANSCGTKH